jgi:acyl carrier protein
MSISHATDDPALLRLIRDVVASVEIEVKVNPADVQLSSTLAGLGIDSVSALEIGAELESRLAIRLPDDQLARVSSIADLVALLRKNVNHAA